MMLSKNYSMCMLILYIRKVIQKNSYKKLGPRFMLFACFLSKSIKKHLRFTGRTETKNKFPRRLKTITI